MWHKMGLIDFRREERTCDSAYPCRDSEMLVVTTTKMTKHMGGCVRVLEFFGELYSLPKGFEGVRARVFIVSTGICGVACPLLPLGDPW